MQQFKRIIRNYKIIIFVIILAIPILVLFVLRFGNFIYKISGANIYIYGVSNTEMFLFLGSYSGGVATLLAIYFTIVENRKIESYKLGDAKIDEELKHVSEAISKLNSLAVSNILTNFKLLEPYEDEYKYSDLIAIRNRIEYEREQIILARVIIDMKSTILDGLQKCEECKKQCKIYKLRMIFRGQYLDIEEKLYEILSATEKYINASAENMKYSLRKLKIENELKTNLSEGSRSILTNRLNICNNKIIEHDFDELAKSFNLQFSDIERFHLEGKTELIHNAKMYYFEKRKQNKETCVLT